MFGVDNRPFEERYPPHAWPADCEPWCGLPGEAEFFLIYASGREWAEAIREVRAVDPKHADVEKGARYLRHLSARRDALMESWAPTGKPQ